MDDRRKNGIARLGGLARNYDEWAVLEMMTLWSLRSSECVCLTTDDAWVCLLCQSTTHKREDEVGPVTHKQGWFDKGKKKTVD